MTDTITITLDDSAAQRTFEELIRRGQDTTDLMQRVAGHLADAAEESFATERSPDGVPWVDLTPSTKARRARQGHWPGPKLQVSNALVKSITVEFGRDYAQIGSNVPYARLHHKGGKAGRNHTATIPARPFLGISPEARDNIQEDMVRWVSLER